MVRAPPSRVGVPSAPPQGAACGLICLAALLLVGCQPAELSDGGSGAQADRAAQPALLYWVGRDGANRLLSWRGPDQEPRRLADLDSAAGYLPRSSLSADGQLLATVNVPVGALGHPQRADLLVGPVEGPWERRSGDALRLQRPVLAGGAVFWVRLDGPPDGPALPLTLLRDDIVLREGRVGWLQFVAGGDEILVYELDPAGRAAIRRFSLAGRDLGTIALGRGEARNLLVDDGTLWMHWRPAGGEAALRGIRLKDGRETTRPAAGFSQRAFVVDGGSILWSRGDRYPEVATSRGVIWRGPGAVWTLDSAPLNGAGEGWSWVGERR